MQQSIERYLSIEMKKTQISSKREKIWNEIASLERKHFACEQLRNSCDTNGDEELHD